MGEYKKDLNSLFNNNMSDRGTSFYCNDRSAHYFGGFYQPFFEKYIGKTPSILEMGVLDLGGINTYNDFFDSDCNLYGIDSDTTIVNDPNIMTLYFADQSDSSQMMLLSDTFGDNKFDIIVDDCSHIPELTWNTFKIMKRCLKKGGIYIIEDLHTNICDEVADKSKTPLYYLTFFDGCEQSILNDIDEVYTFNKSCDKPLKNIDAMYKGRSITMIVTLCK